MIRRSEVYQVSIQSYLMVLQKFEDFIRLSPETTQLNSNDTSDLRWEVYSGVERCFSSGFSLQIGLENFPMENGCIDIPAARVKNLLDPGRETYIELRAENCNWILNRATILPDSLSSTEFKVRQEDVDGKNCLVGEFHFSPMLSGEVKIHYEVYMVNTSSLEIETTSIVHQEVVVPVEKYLIITLNRPPGKFLGITAKIIQGTNYTTLSDSVNEFSISTESDIIPSRFWGKGTSDVSIITYRLTDFKPERVVKDNVRRADLRDLVRKALGKMDLRLETLSLLPIHEKNTCVAKTLLMEFSCLNDDLQKLSEIGYLSDALRLHTNFLSGGRTPVPRYKGGFLTTEIRLSSSELKKLSTIKNPYISTSSSNINLFTLPIKDLFTHDARFGISVRSRSKERVELVFEDGPLCDETIIEEVWVWTKIPDEEKRRNSNNPFCPACGKLFTGIGFDHCYQPGCRWSRPNSSWKKAKNFILTPQNVKDKNSLLIEYDSVFTAIKISFSHGSSIFETEISLGSEHDAV